MTDPDYRTFTDAELAECAATIEAIRQDRRTIATEAEFVTIHEQAATESVAAADKVRADAAAARERQTIAPPPVGADPEPPPIEEGP